MVQFAAQDLFANGVASMKAGDLTAAEAHFRASVQSDPKFVNGLLNLGVLLLNRSAYGEAETTLKQAVTLQATVETVSALASLFSQTGRHPLAEQCYSDILRSIPDHAPTLKRMAELCEAKADRRGARMYYKKAWDAAPTDIGMGISYGVASFTDDPAETVAVMDKLMAIAAGNDKARIKILGGLLLYKEFHERMKRSLMPYHATNLDELFFTFCAADFSIYRDLCIKEAEQQPNDVGALAKKFIALFCSRDRPGAQACLTQFQPAVQNQIWNTISFDPVFYKQLEKMNDDDLVKGLPPVRDVLTANFSDQPIAYLSCNYTYFAAFAAPMIRSLADKSPGAQLHAHIMDATDEQLDQAAALCKSLPLVAAISAEAPRVDKQGMMVARAYYHAVRFIRYYFHLKQHNRTLWLMDVDALFNRDPSHMYRALGDKDAAFRIRAGRFEPWNQFNACIVAATPTAPSILYFRLIAAYIAHFFQKNDLRWGIDQLAMYGVFEYLNDEGRAPSLAFLDNLAIDYDYLDDGIVWCNSGKSKFNHLKRNPDGSLVIDDPDRAKYLLLFDKYYVPDK